MAEHRAHGLLRARGVAMLDRMNDLQMPSYISAYHFRIEPRQSEKPEARCILMQQDHLTFDLLIVTRRS